MTTTVHDSTSCTAGPDGGKCAMCVWADEAEHMERGASLDEARRRESSDCGFESRLNPFPEWSESIHVVERSATAIRTRRTALLDRAAPNSPTDGVIALAEAWLEGEEWYRALVTNTAQDAAVVKLAGRIETAIDEYVEQQQQLT